MARPRPEQRNLKLPGAVPSTDADPWDLVFDCAGWRMCEQSGDVSETPVPESGQETDWAIAFQQRHRAGGLHIRWRQQGRRWHAGVVLDHALVARRGHRHPAIPSVTASGAIELWDE